MRPARAQQQGNNLNELRHRNVTETQIAPARGVTFCDERESSAKQTRDDSGDSKE